jgi:hypothetical protein
VGKHRTGRAFFLVFADDDDKNMAGDCSFRNVRVFECTDRGAFDPVNATPASAPQKIDFKTAELKRYDNSRARSNTVSVLENGAGLRIVGNTGMALSLPREITERTVVEFEFKSTAQGYVHGISFLSGRSKSSSLSLQLYGTRRYGKDTYHDYGAYAPEWRSYRILVGRHFTIKCKYMLILNDQSTKKPAAETVVRNVKIYDLSEK